ncbi:Aa_trans domain-containing protein [Meloidogyne graminicola]|uniref:Aa_trans domain-containing protein n=1 Tax=Meloidogyne graminicola TaxID=189291 RepID=A0A8T0A1U3_9BILA|nr:Aa_trans domain-containing protein [Meloidogyne graminicola]
MAENKNFKKYLPFVINNNNNNNQIFNENIEEKNKEKTKKNGLGWFLACLFVVSDMAGGGLVALPTAMIQAGFWSGIFLSFLMTLIYMTTSIALGKNWVILRRRWPSIYKKHCRQPYPEMGKRALGKWMGNVVSVCVDINQFGTTVVYLLLAAKNIHDTLKALFDTNISFCILLIILAFCLLPITFLNSPQDFWLAAVVAVTTTSLAVILICIGSLLDFNKCNQYHSMPDFRFTNFFLAVGTLLFAYGGHPAFPTIQNDMRKPEDFDKSSLLSFSILFCMYTPVCIIGYLTYGDSLRESVINSLQHVWIQQIVNLMITLHLIFTIIIVNNPLNQKVEEVFNIPHEFGWKRVIIRTGMMALVLFVAETVPSFGPLLDLIVRHLFQNRIFFGRRELGFN